MDACRAIVAAGVLLAATLGPTTPAVADIIGTSGDDQIRGTSRHDWIEGRAGDDVIRALGGDDFVHGDSGDDVQYAGRGPDFMNGWAGNDELHFGAGADWGLGLAGDDKLWGGANNDRPLEGGRGADLVHGGSGDDRVFGNDDSDRLSPGHGSDEVAGGHGGDTIVVTSDDSPDEIDCGPGDDAVVYRGELDTGDTLVRCEQVIVHPVDEGTPAAPREMVVSRADSQEP